MDIAGILSGLTPSQYAAVTHKDGPLLVIAGAGSGKTRVVTRRVAWLLSQGVLPNNILAMTFTNKAAREMRQRVIALTGCNYLNIGTFHSLCAGFLRRDIEMYPAAGRHSNFTIYDEDEQLKVITACLKELAPGPGLTPKNMQKIISDCKNRQVSVYELLNSRRYNEFTGMTSMVEAAYEAYEARMKQCNALDFDDLLCVTVKMLTDLPDLRQRYENRYRYVLVDEYQDTNHLQYELVRLLCGESGNLHVTGDPDQSIYSWRGADYRNIMDFEKDFPSAKVVKLEQNYRSTETILEAANALIRQNEWRFDKELYTENERGTRLFCYSAGNDTLEAAWVCRTILQLRRAGVSYRDIAVFYRTNSQSRPLEESVVRNNIPYQLLGGVRYYERQEVKDCLALLRLKANESDEMALQRVLNIRRCGIGPKTLGKIAVKANENFQTLFGYLCSGAFVSDFGKNAKVREFAEWCIGLRNLPERPVEEVVSAVIEHSQIRDNAEKQYGLENIDERLENLNGMVARAHIYDQDNPDGNLTHFLEETALVADVDSHDGDADCVSLMTLHSSKGLEFPYVFIVGLEEGLLPHVHSSESNYGLEEERRLFYVGLTRAEKAVFLSYAMCRFQYGGNRRTEPSSFLEELPDNLIDYGSQFGSTANTVGRINDFLARTRRDAAEEDDISAEEYADNPKKAEHRQPVDDPEGLYYDFSEGNDIFEE